MNFKKRLIEELNITGGNNYKDLYQEYVDACEKIAKEYHQEQVKNCSISNDKESSLDDFDRGFTAGLSTGKRLVE